MATALQRSGNTDESEVAAALLNFHVASDDLLRLAFSSRAKGFQHELS
jgi:hypothetical protein